MIDEVDGYATVLRRETRKARKTHSCHECGREIERTEKYLFEILVDDGRIRAIKTCAHCQVARAWLDEECDGWVYGSIAQDIYDHAQIDDYYGADLVAMSASIEGRWRALDGTLLPVPSMPKTSYYILA